VLLKSRRRKQRTTCASNLELARSNVVHVPRSLEHLTPLPTPDGQLRRFTTERLILVWFPSLERQDLWRSLEFSHAAGSANLIHPLLVPYVRLTFHSSSSETGPQAVTMNSPRSPSVFFPLSSGASTVTVSLLSFSKEKLTSALTSPPPLPLGPPAFLHHPFSTFPFIVLESSFKNALHRYPSSRSPPPRLLCSGVESLSFFLRRGGPSGPEGRHEPGSGNSGELLS